MKSILFLLVLVSPVACSFARIATLEPETTRTVTVFVDEVDGDYARVLDSEDREWDVPVIALPSAAGEGTYVTLAASVLR